MPTKGRVLIFKVQPQLYRLQLVHQTEKNGSIQQVATLGENHKYLVLAVNSVPCEGCSSGCRVMREAEGEVRLLIRAKISDHGYGDCAKFTIPSHTRGVDRTVEFKDYAPQVFRKIRALFGVPEREYMMSLGPEQVRNSNAMLRAIRRNSGAILAQFGAIL